MFEANVYSALSNWIYKKKYKNKDAEENLDGQS